MVEQAPPHEFIIWPMHITIVPWFPVEDEAKLDEVLRKVAAKHEAFDATAGKVEEWGKKQKFSVQRIDDPGNLHRLHWDIFHSLEKNNFPVHQKDHLGASYRPHIAIRNRKSHKLPEGESLPIISFCLFKQMRLKKTGTMIKELAKEYFLQ
jgi:hypothetical protein